MDDKKVTQFQCNNKSGRIICKGKIFEINNGIITAKDDEEVEILKNDIGYGKYFRILGEKEVNKIKRDEELKKQADELVNLGILKEGMQADIYALPEEAKQMITENILSVIDMYKTKEKPIEGKKEEMNYSKMTMEELRQYADTHDIRYSQGCSKGELVKLIQKKNNT